MSVIFLPWLCCFVKTSARLLWFADSSVTAVPKFPRFLAWACTCLTSSLACCTACCSAGLVSCWACCKPSNCVLSVWFCDWLCCSACCICAIWAANCRHQSLSKITFNLRVRVLQRVQEVTKVGKLSLPFPDGLGNSANTWPTCQGCVALWPPLFGGGPTLTYRPKRSILSIMWESD